MNKVLVCINDGLLKLRIRDVLQNQNIAFTITDKPIRKDELYLYDLLIVHTSYKLTGLQSFIETLVVNKVITVFVITSNLNYNIYRHLMKSTYFMIVSESKMDTELPLSITHYDKFNNRIKELEIVNRDLSTKLDEINFMNKCKRFLMSNGYTENDAHKYIVKYAMDNQINKIEACKSLLDKSVE